MKKDKRKWIWIVSIIVLIVLIGGWWFWRKLFISPSTKLNETIEGVSYRVPTDPTVVVFGFRTCDGEEYCLGSDVKLLKKISENEFSPVKIIFNPNSLPVRGKDYDMRIYELEGTFGLVNPTINTGLVRVHGYEIGARMRCNIIEDVEKIILISNSECIPSVSGLNFNEWKELTQCEVDSNCSCFNAIERRGYYTFKNICINKGSLEQKMSQYPNLYFINESEVEFCLNHICKCRDNICITVEKIS